MGQVGQLPPARSFSAANGKVNDVMFDSSFQDEHSSATTIDDSNNSDSNTSAKPVRYNGCFAINVRYRGIIYCQISGMEAEVDTGKSVRSGGRTKYLGHQGESLHHFCIP